MAEMQVKTVDGEAQLVPAEGVIAKDNNGTMEQTVAPIGEHPNNYQAVEHDQVGYYQGDTDVKGTVFIEPELQDQVTVNEGTQVLPPKKSGTQPQGNSEQPTPTPNEPETPETPVNPENPETPGE